ncbi:hypothetical protein ASPVEDRAFT_148689 [Aspergillus versicolor CBS 583.65]|uniref:AMP-dependent synthetase/ligase domain-containing protein n=1 Tax=Aspergillus versicolor CBS 583.65 TaxID=1036611 RepID=A0A1L9PDU2_ASPVE|nr:uncharacterized protein ASPVEDRAFT_148689 [Aspergillus versicolor CBS 583.65]OJI99662.1 hypothetical protein ASPVEDRAFT_148689 [Aspergillus versicolor CBS 583.65]
MDNPTATPYSLHDILTVASIHPFYRSDAQYPPDAERIKQILEQQKDTNTPSLASVPLTYKKDLYKAIQRLSTDRSRGNVYRHSSYISTTGGGSGGIPMAFLTDSTENRAQRAHCGRLMRLCGVIEPGDWIVTVHTSGNLYRSLDLMAERMEYAGGSVLCAGHLMPHPELVQLFLEYRANVLCGDSSQILQFALHVASLPAAMREALCIDKILYTSEPLVRSQRNYLISVFGSVKICSAFANAESGPWCVMNMAITGDKADDAADFIFDTRTILVEVLSPSAVDESQTGADPNDQTAVKEVHPLPDGETGSLVLTSLQRLRNPLVRYASGDVGALLPLPSTHSIPAETAQHLKVLRLRGRDQRFSFKWQGNYFEFHFLREFMQREDLGVLQWQLILSDDEASHAHHCEVRILRGTTDKPDDEVAKILERVFEVTPVNAPLFHVTFLGGTRGFERSATGNKVMRFVDRSTQG